MSGLGCFAHTVEVLYCQQVSEGHARLKINIPKEKRDYFLILKWYQIGAQ